MSGEREDGFEFLPDDDELDEDAALDDDMGPEARALHVTDGDDIASHDPGRSDVTTSDEDEDDRTVDYFDDEEPESPAAERPDDEETGDVEDVLIRQHYAFDDEDEDDEVAGAPAAERWRRRLEDERIRVTHLREQLSGDLTQAEEAGELASVDQHQADSASNTYEIEQVRGQIEDLDAELADIDDAFARVEAGTYGRCQVCDKLIAPERLAAVPLTRHCLQHG